MENKTVKKGKWSRDELDFLIRNYGLMTSTEISEKLERSVVAVRSMVFKKRLRFCFPKEIDNFEIDFTLEEKTLCWDCKWATNPEDSPCSWARFLKPVEGWETHKTKLHDCSSVTVDKCPLFVRDKRRGEK